MAKYHTARMEATQDRARGGNPTINREGEYTGGYGVQRIGDPIPAWKQQKQKGNPGGSYSNTIID